MNTWGGTANKIEIFLASTNEIYDQIEHKKIQVSLAQIILMPAIEDLLVRLKGIYSSNTEQIIDWAQTVDHLSGILRTRCLRGTFNPSETTDFVNESQYDNAWFEFLLYGFRHDLFHFGKKKQAPSQQYVKNSFSEEERIEVRRFLEVIGYYDSEKLTVKGDEQDDSEGQEELNSHIKPIRTPDTAYLDKSENSNNDKIGCCKNCGAYFTGCLCSEPLTLGVPCMKAMIERNEQYNGEPGEMDFLSQWLLRYTDYLNKELLRHLNLSFATSPQERYDALMKVKQRLFA
jgi:hypothetical protein